MRKCEASPIGQLLHETLRREGLESPLNEYRLLSSWEEVMGHGIGRYTGNLFIKNQVLNVQITSPTLRNELNMSHTRIAQRLNAHIQANVICDVRFY